ncbi:hypothetical protein [Noviherbaspirillum sp. ST9]|uniref:hypothetical protein n=1 Tax=Noviherbaspirillum sp. ST9 TaxID=3401606 RepID=UPI003B588A11
MPSTLSAIVLVVASTAALAAVPCRALESGSAAKAAASKRDMRDTGKAQHKARKSEKEAPRRIVTYNLFQDPVFKLNGALADKRQLGMPPAFDRHGHSRPGLAAKVSAAPVNVPELKLPEPESAGVDFGCSDKPFRNRAKTPELTACYKHSVDRSWKTQTYLSREYTTDGTQKWGGGVAVRYAY